jgi:hypothetical protein
MLWQRGHFWIAIAGAVLCVLRARFLRFDVRLFGTAIFFVQLNVELIREADRGLTAGRPNDFRLLRERSRTFPCSNRYHMSGTIPCNRLGTPQNLAR